MPWDVLQELGLVTWKSLSDGPVAQWIRHRPTEPGIAGSSPAGVIFARLCCLAAKGVPMTSSMCPGVSAGSWRFVQPLLGAQGVGYFDMILTDCSLAVPDGAATDYSRPPRDPPFFV